MAANDTVTYKRNDLSIYQKIALLQRYDSLPKCSQRKAALELHVSQPLLCKLLKNRESLLNSSQAECDFSRKRRRSGKDSAIEEALFKWYILARQADVPISRRILVTKAQEFANLFGNTKFRATDGWLSRWKQRNNVIYKRTHQKYDAKSDPLEVILDDMDNQPIALNISSRKDHSSINDDDRLSNEDQNENHYIAERLNPRDCRDLRIANDSNQSSNENDVKDEVIDFSTGNMRHLDDNNSIMVTCRPKQESEECSLPPYEEAKRALLVIRRVILGHSETTLDDIQSFYNIESCLSKIYADTSK